MKIESNLVPYNPDDLISACHNLNQIYIYLNNRIKRLHDDDKALLFTLFDNTYAGDVIKEINSKKKPKKKTQKSENVDVTNPNL